MLCQCKESVIQKNETKYETGYARGAAGLVACMLLSFDPSSCKACLRLCYPILEIQSCSILLEEQQDMFSTSQLSPAITAPINSTFFLAFGFSPVFLGLFHGWLLDLFIFLLSFCLASYELAFILYLSLLIMPWIRLFNGY